MSKNNQDVLNRPIHLKMLIGFSLPTILSMVFMSIYTTVDGLFVARLGRRVAVNADRRISVICNERVLQKSKSMIKYGCTTLTVQSYFLI